GLRRQRRRDRALPGAAGEHELLALRVRDRLGVEGRERHDHAAWIGFDGDLVGLADVDRAITSLLDSPLHLFRCHIMVLLVSHAPLLTILPKRAPKSPLAQGKSSAANGLMSLPKLQPKRQLSGSYPRSFVIGQAPSAVRGRLIR